MGDVRIQNHGTLFSFALDTATAREWVKKNVECDDLMLSADGYVLVVEHRYARDIARGMIVDGLEVK